MACLMSSTLQLPLSKFAVGLYPDGNPTNYEQTAARAWAMDVKMVGSCLGGYKNRV